MAKTIHTKYDYIAFLGFPLAFIGWASAIYSEYYPFPNQGLFMWSGVLGLILIFLGAYLGEKDGVNEVRKLSQPTPAPRSTPIDNDPMGIR